MLESKFQSQLIEELGGMLPGCVVLFTDPRRIQGIPDLIVLHGNRWVMLEVKASGTASHRPNQDYYVRLFGAMSFAAFIHPANKEEVLNEVQKALTP
jgi:hypothetical protein